MSSPLAAPQPPAFETVASLPDGALIERYRAGTMHLDPRVLRLSDEQLDTHFRPDAGVGRWSCRVLLGHLADAELAFVHRVRRTVAEDRPLLSAWDENAYIDRGLYSGEKGGADRPVAAFVAVLHTLRAWHAEWLRTITPQDWKREALHPERGPQTVRIIMNYATWHLEHHAWYLARKLEKFMGPADPREWQAPNH